MISNSAPGSIRSSLGAPARGRARHALQREEVEVADHARHVLAGHVHPRDQLRRFEPAENGDLGVETERADRLRVVADHVVIGRGDDVHARRCEALHAIFVGKARVEARAAVHVQVGGEPARRRDVERL
jgi:hypothetical protein